MHPDETTVVDPFGEVSRLYQPQELAPVMNVTAITHRTGAIFQDVFSGHREHFLLGLIPREGSILNYLEARHGGVTAVALPLSGYGRAICYVSIRKRDSGQPKQVALSALAHSGVQTVVIVDEDIDVFNEEDVMREVPAPAEEDLVDAISGNLCRCTGYQQILEAARSVVAGLSEPAGEA